MQRSLFPKLHPKSQMSLLFSNFGKTLSRSGIEVILILYLQNIIICSFDLLKIMSEYDTHNIYSFNAVTNPTMLGPLQEIYLFPTLVFKKNCLLQLACNITCFRSTLWFNIYILYDRNTIVSLVAICHLSPYEVIPVLLTMLPVL